MTSTRTHTRLPPPVELLDNLKSRNPHHRDKFLHFEPKWHKYTITCDAGAKYVSVTGVSGKPFPKFDPDDAIQKIFGSRNFKEGHKYWGMSAQQIKNQWEALGKVSSEAGTNMHNDIETFMNHLDAEDDDGDAVVFDHQDLIDSYLEDIQESQSRVINSSKEFTFFLNFVQDYPRLTPFRTEWMIWDDDLKLAGSIDMVYQNDDGSLSIYDWKRSKDEKLGRFHDFGTMCDMPGFEAMHATDFWKYSLQLNIYKAILERKYGHTVRDLWLVQLHPDSATGTYNLHRVPFLKSHIRILFDQLNPGWDRRLEECGSGSDSGSESESESHSPAKGTRARTKTNTKKDKK